MLFFIVLLLSIPIGASLFGRKYKKLYILIVSVVLISIAGLRHTASFHDTTSYVYHYETVSDEGPFYEVPQERFEKGYLVFEKFVHKYISDESPALLTVVALFAIGVPLLFFYRKSKILWLSIFLFIGIRLYFMQIQAVRQALGVALVLMSYMLYSSQKKSVLPFLLAFLAPMFHSSAICGWLIFLMPHIKFNRTTLFWFLSLGGIFVTFTSSLVSTFSGSFNHENTKYLTDDNMQLAVWLYIIFYGILIFVSYKLNRAFFRRNENRTIVWSSLFCFLCFFFSLKITALERMAFYFQPFLIVLITNSLYELKSKTNLIFSLCLLVFLMFISVLVLKPEWNWAYPYYFYWEDIPDEIKDRLLIGL